MIIILAFIVYSYKCGLKETFSTQSDLLLTSNPVRMRPLSDYDFPRYARLSRSGNPMYITNRPMPLHCTKINCPCYLKREENLTCYHC